MRVHIRISWFEKSLEIQQSVLHNRVIRFAGYQQGIRTNYNSTKMPPAIRAIMIADSIIY